MGYPRCDFCNGSENCEYCHGSYNEECTQCNNTGKTNFRHCCGEGSIYVDEFYKN